MRSRPPTIVAMGGGGFSMEPENPLLDEYVLQAAGVERPAICFLPTASGDPEGYVESFHAAFGKLDARPSHLFLPWEAEPDGLPEDGRPSGSPSIADPADHLAAQDVVYVGGGNTRRMLAVWRAYGIDRVLEQLWRSGTVVLAGLSAGSLCWYEEGVTDSIPGALTPMTCLGFLPGSHCPHYDGEVERRPSYERLVADGRLAPGIAADDGCALLYEGRELVDVVASRPQAAAWRVDRVAGGAVSRRTDARYLG
ncbi:MAG: peptidase E [Planctomycetota bacterium]|nr:peptidase E [Planctomycetota bacterium]